MGHNAVGQKKKTTTKTKQNKKQTFEQCFCVSGPAYYYQTNNYLNRQKQFYCHASKMQLMEREASYQLKKVTLSWQFFFQRSSCVVKLPRSASSEIHCIPGQNFTALSLAGQYDPQHWPIFSKHCSRLRVRTCNAKLSS